MGSEGKQGEHHCVSYHTFVLVSGGLGALVLVLLGVLLSDRTGHGELEAQVELLAAAKHPVAAARFNETREELIEFAGLARHNAAAILELKSDHREILAAIAAVGG